MGVAIDTFVKTTFMIILAFSFMNLCINGIIYLSSKKENYLKLSLFWLALILNFIIQAGAQNGIHAIIFGFGFAVLPLSLLAYASLSFTNQKYPWKTITPTAPLALIITLAIIDKPLPFTVKALPFAAASALPLLYTFYVYILKKETKPTTLMKFHAAIVLFLAIHTFNFAFFRMVPDAQLWGWPVAYALYQLLAGVIPALTLDFYHRKEEGRLRDIIDARTNELQCANSDLQTALKQKDYLFKTLTHDISTPLTIARLNLSLFKTKPSNVDGFIQKMSDLTLRMEQLVCQVRNFEAVQEGSQNFSTKPENLLNCVTAVETMFEDNLINKNIQLIYDKELLGKVEVNVDVNSFINSVLMNIISNSIKFCRPGGHIKIDAYEKNDKTINLSIEDNGIGMPKRIKDNLFNFESKTSRRGTENEPGTGFGIPIIKRIIQSYGGEIIVTSEEQNDETQSFTRFDLILQGNNHDASIVA